MKRQRIYFTAWGRGTWEAPAWAMLVGEWDDPSDAVARAIARKSGLDICGFRPDGCGVTRGEIDSHHYQMTLGIHLRSGGYAPEAEVWFSIATQVGC